MDADTFRWYLEGLLDLTIVTTKNLLLYLSL